MAASDFLNERGKETSKRLFGTSQRASATDGTDEEYQKLQTDFVLNGMYSRTVISPKVRQLIAVACLAALYRPHELRSHIRAGLRLAEPEEVQEAILQSITYGGFPSAMEGLRIFAEVLAERAAEAGAVPKELSR